MKNHKIKITKSLIKTCHDIFMLIEPFHLTFLALDFCFIFYVIHALGKDGCDIEKQFVLQLNRFELLNHIVRYKLFEVSLLLLGQLQTNRVSKLM